MTAPGRRRQRGTLVLYGPPLTRWKRALDLVSKHLDEITQHLPAKPIDEWTIEELLADGARLGLIRLREFALRVCAEDDERAQKRPAWENRLVLEASTTMAKLLANIEAEKFRARQSAEQHDALLKRVDSFEKALYNPTKKT